MPVRSWSSSPSELCPRHRSLRASRPSFCLLALLRRRLRGRSHVRVLCRSLGLRPPGLRRASVVLQGFVPRLVFGLSTRTVRPVWRPWLSWVSAPLQGPPSPLAQRVLPPLLLPRAWLSRFTPRTQPRPSSRATGVTGSSESSRARDRPRLHARRDTPSWGSPTSSLDSSMRARLRPGSWFRLGCLGSSRSLVRSLFGRRRRGIGPRTLYRSRSCGSREIGRAHV